MSGTSTTLFDLNEVDSTSCLLVGGQMMHLLSVEHAAPVVRPTDDVDVVVDSTSDPSPRQRETAALSFLIG